LNGLLVRVGADQSKAGGYWNSPVNSLSREFIYVAIPESCPIHPGLDKPYAHLDPLLAKIDVSLPEHLRYRRMHLDPDFARLTYGDQGQRAKQLQDNLNPGDLIVFYAGLAGTFSKARLVYAIIGFYVVEDFILAASVTSPERDINAHSRRMLDADAQDLIVRACPVSSGRLERCIPIGEYRDRAYRVRKDLLIEWGGLSVNNGYLQRSARLPRLLDTEQFLIWWKKQNPTLLHVNN